jgi:hypothetical protein
LQKCQNIGTYFITAKILISFLQKLENDTQNIVTYFIFVNFTKIKKIFVKKSGQNIATYFITANILTPFLKFLQNDTQKIGKMNGGKMSV